MSVADYDALTHAEPREPVHPLTPADPSPFARAYEAWREVIRIVQPMPREQQRRVLRAALALLGLDGPE